MAKEVKLLNWNKDDVVTLFCDCFSENRYYKELFNTPFSGLLKEKMARSFKESIVYATDSGMSLGLVDQYDRLRAFLLAFDYNACLKNNSELFYEIFGGIKEEGVEGLPYYRNFHKVLLEKGNVLYIMSCGVDYILRNCGYATQLVHSFLIEHPGCSVAGDVTSDYMVRIFNKLDYNIEEIKDDYWICRNF